MCASSPFATETTIGSGGGGLLTTTLEMKRSFTTVRNSGDVESRRCAEVHSAPTSNDVLRSGFEVRIALADLRAPADDRSS